MLSEKNRKRAEQGLNLIIDEEWVKIFPEDKKFMGQTIPVAETILCPIEEDELDYATDTGVRM